MQSATTPPTDLVSVGHITGAFGVQGWVKIHPYSPDAGALLHTKTWWLGRSSVRDPELQPDLLTDLHDVEKLEAKLHGDEVVARFVGIVERNGADKLKGCVVQVSRSHFPELLDNEFYWLDLIGLHVENLQNESLGVVVGLIENGAHPILRVVQSSDSQATPATSKKTNSPAREYLIPFVEHFVPNVDQKNKKITVDWGLDF